MISSIHDLGLVVKDIFAYYKISIFVSADSAVYTLMELVLQKLQLSIRYLSRND